jgi:hypothetical protein
MAILNIENSKAKRPKTKNQSQDRPPKYPAPRALLKFLQPYDPSIRQLALRLRAVVLNELSPCCENIYDAYSAVALGYGPTARLQHGVCHIAVYTRHVNLGFNQGATLPDPKRLLQGTGKWIRHITFRSEAEVQRPEVLQYLRRAHKLSLQDKSTPTGPRTLVSSVKRIYQKKRRPGSKK